MQNITSSHGCHRWEKAMLNPILFGWNPGTFPKIKLFKTRKFFCFASQKNVVVIWTLNPVKLGCINITERYFTYYSITLQYNKVYNLEEYYHRLQIFTENKRRIDQHNERNHKFSSKKYYIMFLCLLLSLVSISSINFHCQHINFISLSELTLPSGTESVLWFDFRWIQKILSLDWAPGMNDPVTVNCKSYFIPEKWIELTPCCF